MINYGLENHQSKDKLYLDNGYMKDKDGNNKVLNQNLIWNQLDQFK